MLRLAGVTVVLASGCWSAQPAAPAHHVAAPRVVAPSDPTLTTHVVDADTEAPVAGAMVIVVRQDVTPSDIDLLRWQQVANGHGRLVDELVVSSGRCDGAGKVTLHAPPRGTYDVVVLGRDHEPLHGARILRISEDQLPLDPFGQLRLVKRKPDSR
ncbi:MAG: hypothetical protein KF773_33080 [Deltaproteobacteria bacterium]|nr:hypothetical protein [Deltaproteobacteria bacterium]MCW5805196.1 hypothetical protein [Deltaproteobacteria bacterium]